MKRSKSEYVIQTVTNAMRLLETFHQADELGVTELSRRLDLHKNNVFRLLATLEEKGYVEQCADSDRYRLASGCLELGAAFSRSRSLCRQARPILERLAAESRESAHLAQLSGFDVVHLDGEEPAQLVRTGARVGVRLPAYCTALGRALLAYADPALWERFDRECVQRGGLEARTRATTTDRDKFFEELRNVSAQGYATDLEECEVGLCCTAAPVYDASGTVVGALSISGPSVRLDRDTLVASMAPRVVAAAAELSRALGHSG